MSHLRLCVSRLRTGYLPVVPYIGLPKTLCHLRRDKKPRCCLAIDEVTDFPTFFKCAALFVFFFLPLEINVDIG